MSYETDVLALTGFSAADLSAAFKLVENKNHWKDPIDAVIPVDKAGIVTTAVEFYTATKPLVLDYAIVENHYCPLHAGLVRIVAAGYRAGPAGDH